MQKKLERIYGKKTALEILPKIKTLISDYKKKVIKKPKYRFTEKDSILITYPDQFTDNDHRLLPLKRFRKKYVGDSINSIL